MCQFNGRNIERVSNEVSLDDMKILVECATFARFGAAPLCFIRHLQWGARLIPANKVCLLLLQ